MGVFFPGTSCYRAVVAPDHAPLPLPPSPPSFFWDPFCMGFQDKYEYKRFLPKDGSVPGREPAPSRCVCQAAGRGRQVEWVEAVPAMDRPSLTLLLPLTLLSLSSAPLPPATVHLPLPCPPPGNASRVPVLPPPLPPSLPPPRPPPPPPFPNLPQLLRL